jgi:hypothetical protein
MTVIDLRRTVHALGGRDGNAAPPPMRRRVLLTLPGDRYAAMAEDRGVPGPRRYLSVLFIGSEVAERRYSADAVVALSHARAMLAEQAGRERST